jgi:hypothetical protein
MIYRINNDHRGAVQPILFVISLVFCIGSNLPGASFDESAGKILAILQDPATPVEEGATFTATGAESTRRALSIARQTNTMKQEKPIRVVRVATKDVPYGKYDTYAIMMSSGPQIVTICWYDPAGTGDWLVYAAVIEQNKPTSIIDRPGR